MNKEFILYLKSVKKKKKLTNEKLSYLANVPLGTINKLFSGDTENPKMSTISAVCKALDVSIEDMEGNNETDGFNVRMTLKSEEAELIQNWRKLDVHGKSLISTVMLHEAARVLIETPVAAAINDDASGDSQREAVRLPMPDLKKTSQKKSAKFSAGFSVPLYELPVSAGLGMLLEDTPSHNISVPKNISYEAPDFALKIRGDSMEPEYHDGEIIIIKNVPSVQKGELGIFNVDGEAFFKIFGGDRLISLNKKYSDIKLTPKNSAECIGKVIGKLQ